MKVVHCPCGVNVEGETDDALVENVQAHVGPSTRIRSASTRERTSWRWRTSTEPADRDELYPGEEREVVESGALAHLVTINPNGRPQVTCVWVGLDGDEIICGHLGATQQKLKNVARDPRVSLSIEAPGEERDRDAALPRRPRPRAGDRGRSARAAAAARARPTSGPASVPAHG